tara:strand:+ start:76 stop:732 length:657 start_codon:yes stop_codon:yes gene_type:complete
MLILKGIHYQPATAESSILRGIDLEVRKGNPAIITGESGSGKTSLLEVISGLSKPQKGKILLNQNSLSERERRWLCGIVFQFPERHFLGLNVISELKLGHRRLNSEDIMKVLKKVGLSDIDLKQAPEKLSGGQQRRLALATQLLKEPPILLLDEPTAGLDWSIRDEIVDLLENLSKEKILIVMSHEPEQFKRLLTPYFQLKCGRLHKMSRLRKHQGNT